MNITNDNLDKIKRWYTTDVGLFIYSIIKLSGSSSYLELGVGHGYTLICAGLALKQNKSKNYELYGIETKQNRVEHINNELNKYELNGAVYQGDADNYNWEKQIDVLFIDSGHKEMQNNINKYAPYVKKIFICHDVFNDFKFPIGFNRIYFKEAKMMIAIKMSDDDFFEKFMIDIILLTFNRKKILQRTLEAIWERTKTHYRLIVVDNGSGDGTVKFLKGLKNQGRISELVLCNNEGLCDAYNQAFKKVKSEYCITTQDDLIPPDLQPDWLSQMKDLLDRHPDHGAIAMRVARMINTKFKNDEEIGYSKRACCAYFRIHKKSILEKNEFPFGERKGLTDDIEFKKLMLRIGLKAGFARDIWANHIGHSQVDNKGYGNFTGYKGYSEGRNLTKQRKPYPKVDLKTNIPL